MIELTPRSLEELSDVRVAFFQGTAGASGRSVLVIRFSGTYRVGCQGNPDAAFMTAMGKAGLEAFDATGLLLDLSELDYRWGDMLDLVLALGDDPPGPLARLFGERPRPRAVLVGPRCRVAIGTLLFGLADPRDPTEREGYFDRLEDAWAWLGAKHDEPPETPLHRAVRADDLAAVDDLLASGAPVDARSTALETPLHLARSAPVAARLLASGAAVDARTCFDQTPLHQTADVAIARVLLAAGADPDARDLVGETPRTRPRSVEVERLLATARRR